mgnify:CR=1 FL=1
MKQWRIISSPPCAGRRGGPSTCFTRPGGVYAQAVLGEDQESRAEPARSGRRGLRSTRRSPRGARGARSLASRGRQSADAVTPAAGRGHVARRVERDARQGAELGGQGRSTVAAKPRRSVARELELVGARSVNHRGGVTVNNCLRTFHSNMGETVQIGVPAKILPCSDESGAFVRMWPHATAPSASGPRAGAGLRRPARRRLR